MSMKTIKVAFVGPVIGAKGNHYKVLVIKNSVLYYPGELLCNAEVNDLCANSAWDVTVVPLEVK